jgi:hypothetical protein
MVQMIRGTHSDHKINFYFQETFMYMTENVCVDLKVLRQKYKTRHSLIYIPSSIHSSVTFKIFTGIDK